MSGKRAKSDPGNIEGSGFGMGDPVLVSHCGNDSTRGRVENVHGPKRDKVDVRIDHPKHPEHGRVVTFSMDEVTAQPLENGKKEKAEKAEAAS